MLKIEDFRAIPLFAKLDAPELERLAKTSADLHLAAGEFAVPEGGDRALYAVLAGKIQVVKMIDGIERTLGWRVPGQIFGEVPITFGMAFVGGYAIDGFERLVGKASSTARLAARPAPPTDWTFT